jgi:hypothetical protein
MEPCPEEFLGDGHPALDPSPTTRVRRRHELSINTTTVPPTGVPLLAKEKL